MHNQMVSNIKFGSFAVDGRLSIYQLLDHIRGIEYNSCPWADFERKNRAIFGSPLGKSAKDILDLMGMRLGIVCVCILQMRSGYWDLM